MADTSILASAVILPEFIDTSSQPAKRRRSSVSSNDSKRPRLDIPAAALKAEPAQTQVPQSATSNNTVHSPDTASPIDGRRRQSTAKDEERKRGKRLFGGLLGTLSQSSGPRTAKRKEEAEKKQQEKLRELEEKQAHEEKFKKEELERVRREQQERWDATSKRIRHDNMRAMANFLETEAAPKLYFKPWELLPRQAEQIKQQLVDVETQISAENDDQSPQNDHGVALDMTVPDGEEKAETTIPVGTDSQDQTDTTPAKADEDMQQIETTDPSTAIYHTPQGEDVSMDAVEEIEAAVEAGEDAVVY